jgi:multidrug efflux pump
MNGKKFNLSEWALKHQSFVWYLMFVAVLAGIVFVHEPGAR